MKLTDYATIVKAKIDDSAATVDQYIIDSVNALSNLFSIPSSDITQSTAVAGTTLTKPALSVRIKGVIIAGEEVLPLEANDDLAEVKADGLQRWYISDGKIAFTAAFKTIEAAIISYDKGFIIPTAGLDTDVPGRFDELVTLGAVARYYDRLIAAVVTNREKYPDVKPDEIKSIAENYWARYLKLMNAISIRGYEI